jgi:hypothetical protein
MERDTGVVADEQRKDRAAVGEKGTSFGREDGAVAADLGGEPPRELSVSSRDRSP